MARPPRLTPRKVPQQDRSRALVSSMLIAARRLLLEHGFEGCSVVDIARVAGVSPGSLYQYFPSKESLITALHVGLLEDHNGYVAENLLRHRDAPLADVADVLAQAYLQLAEDDGAVVDALSAVEHSLDSTRKLEPVRAASRQLFAGFLRSRPEVAEAEVMLRAAMIADVLPGAARTAVRAPSREGAAYLCLRGLARSVIGAVPWTTN